MAPFKVTFAMFVACGKASQSLPLRLRYTAFMMRLDSILKEMKPQQHNSVTLIKVENHAKIIVRCHLYMQERYEIRPLSP